MLKLEGVNIQKLIKLGVKVNIWLIFIYKSLHISIKKSLNVTYKYVATGKGVGTTWVIFVTVKKCLSILVVNNE